MSTITAPPPEVVTGLVGAICALFRVSIDVIGRTYEDNAENFNRLNNLRRGPPTNTGPVSAGNGGKTRGGVGGTTTTTTRNEKRSNDLSSFLTQAFGSKKDKGSNGTTVAYGTFHGRNNGVNDIPNGNSSSSGGYRPVPTTPQEANNAVDESSEDVEHASKGQHTPSSSSSPKQKLGHRLSLLVNVTLFLYFAVASAMSTTHGGRWTGSFGLFTGIPLLPACASSACFLNFVVLFRDYERKRFGIVQRSLYVCSTFLLLLSFLVLAIPAIVEDEKQGGAGERENTFARVDVVTLVALVSYVVASLWESISSPLNHADADEEDGTRPSKPALSRRAIFVMLKPYFWPDATNSSAAMNRVRAITTWFCVAFAKACSLAAPIFIGQASTALSRLDYAGCVRNSVIYATITFAGNFFKEAQSLVYLKVAQAAFVQLSEVSFHHLQSLSLDWHLRKKLGEVIRSMDRGISACDTLMKFLFLRLVPAMAECLLVVIIFSTYFNHFALSVSVFFFVFVYVILTIVMTLWRKKFRRAVSKSDNDWHDRCTDSLVNFETVKYFTAEEYEMKRFGEAVKKYQSGSVAVAASLSLLNVLQNFILQSCLATGLILSAMGIRDRMNCCVDHGCDEGNSDCCSALEDVCPGMEVGDFVAVLTYTIQLFTPLSFLGTIYNAIVMAMVDLSNLSELLAENPDVVDAPDAVLLPETNRVDTDTDIAVEFDNVYFRYPTQANNMGLKGVSFKMKRGTVTGVVGATGAGKTTVSRLFFRFYDVQSGAVKVNGVDVRSVTQKSLRQAVGVVPQTTALFNDTIRSNVLYGRPNATQEDLDKVASAAQLDGFIKQLPEGWDSVVGDRGLKLSGGEKQRTAIARCLLKDPPFLILDEATSSLDTLTEDSVQEALEGLRNDRTCLVIAHRLGTVKSADNIIVLGNGKVLEEGTHDELLALDGAYSDMWRVHASD